VGVIIDSLVSPKGGRGHRGEAVIRLGELAPERAIREQVVEGLVAARVLWPLVDHGPSCRACAAPRRPPVGQDVVKCRACRDLAELYVGALADLYPISYTTPDGSLCAVVRELKDKAAACLDSSLARDIAAILSAYLETQLRLGGLGGGRFDVVTAVPSSRSVIAAALRRAAEEGWWSCELAAVASARPGHRRQRERSYRARSFVRGKWRVDRAAVDGLDVLVLDDIYTSGGSVHSFAYALRQAGAASVRAVVLARNLWADDMGWVPPLLRARCDAGERWMPSTGKYDVIGRDVACSRERAFGAARQSSRWR
jgi:adenine/guanine phosphoribosyltransferase-like PRPP-binding protein